MNDMYIWHKILTTVAKASCKLVYFGIGSEMNDCHKITELNNSQYPCYLNKFEGNKVIILFDSQLETPLKIEKYFEDKWVSI